MITYTKVNQAEKEVTASLNCRGVSTYKVKTQKKLKKSTFYNLYTKVNKVKKQVFEALAI